MSKVNELLGQLDEAYEAAEEKAKEASAVRKDAAEAIAAIQSELDAVKADHAARVAAADAAVEEARAILTKLRDQVNERVGNLTAIDPRVSVR